MRYFLKFTSALLIGIVLSPLESLQAAAKLTPYPQPLGYLPYLVLRCKIGDEPFETTKEDIQNYTSSEFPGVGDFINLASQGKAQIDFSAITEVLQLPGTRADYLVPETGGFDLGKVYEVCAQTAFFVHGQRVDEFSGVLLVNNQGISAVTGLHIPITIAGETIDRPVVYSSHEHIINNHHVLAHELGHSLAEFGHAGGGFDPMGFGNICRESTKLGCTHSYFIGIHRRHAGWFDPKNLAIIPQGENPQTVSLISVADFLENPKGHKNSKVEAVFEKTIGGVPYEFSIEYRRFKSYDTNIVDEGISLHLRQLQTENPLAEVHTIDFPNSENTRNPTLKFGDSYVVPRDGLFIEPVRALRDGASWEISVLNSPKALERFAFAGPHNIPGRLEAENFDEGYQGWTYFDKDLSNNGGEYRINERVDLEKNSPDEKGVSLAWTRNNEWLEYTIQAPDDGNYNIRIRGSNANAGDTKLHFFVEGTPQGHTNLSTTGGWQKWQTFEASKPVSLKQGSNIFRVKFECRYECHNINWFEFTN